MRRHKVDVAVSKLIRNVIILTYAQFAIVDDTHVA